MRLQEAIAGTGNLRISRCYDWEFNVVWLWSKGVRLRVFSPLWIWLRCVLISLPFNICMDEYLIRQNCEPKSLTRWAVWEVDHSHWVVSVRDKTMWKKPIPTYLVSMNSAMSYLSWKEDLKGDLLGEIHGDYTLERVTQRSPKHMLPLADWLFWRWWSNIPWPPEVLVMVIEDMEKTKPLGLQVP